MKQIKILLDSSALLATFQQESGSARVIEALHTAHSAITTANLAEVVSILATRSNIPLADSIQLLDNLPLSIIDISKVIAIQSAALHATFPKKGLSLGDRLCLATGIIYGWPILTADTAWLTINTGAKVELIR